ncbi:MAG: ABC transporter permease subunit [Candidatus Thermoplasmatota archaeon]
MKTGKTMLMEIKNSWKGFLIFLLVIVLLIAGFAQAYPSFEDALDDELEGADRVDVEVVEEEDSVTVRLSWTGIEDAENYTLLVSRSPTIIVPMDRVEGIQNESYNYTLPLDEEGEVPERYFSVIAVKEWAEENDSSELVGMQTNFERTSALEEVWGIDYGNIQGFISVLWSMWWILLIGLYIGYISVNVITWDYEESRMDIIFSTPLSRRRYLLEKLSAYSLFSLLLVVVSGLVLTLSVYSAGEGFRLNPFLVSIVISWPMLMVIVSVSMFFAVLFKNSRTAVGATFAVILVQYALFMAGNMLEALEPVLPWTISYYWDYNSVLLDGAVHPLHLLLLIAVAIVLSAFTILLFEDSDFPA